MNTNYSNGRIQNTGKRLFRVNESLIDIDYREPIDTLLIPNDMDNLDINRMDQLKWFELR